jgi:Protein of unknown function (DUF1566)
MGHLEFDELKRAVADLLGHSLKFTPGKASAAKPVQRTPKEEVSEGVYLDPETKLMWTIEDNGKDIDWHEASEYARQLRLGGYSDWRLPTIEELEQLYAPRNKGIREPFLLTYYWVWSSTRTGSARTGLDSAWYFDFDDDLCSSRPMAYSNGVRALCVSRSGE